MDIKLDFPKFNIANKKETSEYINYIIEFLYNLIECVTFDIFLYGWNKKDFLESEGQMGKMSNGIFPILYYTISNMVKNIIINLIRFQNKFRF